MPSKYIDASHNFLFTLPKAKWLEDLAKSDAGDITGYQECEGSGQRATLKEHCAATGRGLYHPKSCGNPISWKKDLFSPVRIDGKNYRGVIEAHLGATAMGVDAKFNPPRDFAYVGLTHTETGKKVLRINVHPLAGGTKLESNPDNRDSVALSKYKDWGIGQYWLDVLSYTAGQMSKQDPGLRAMTNYWDIVTIGGDYNAAMSNKDRWYYPANLLAPLFVPDSLKAGLDHMQHGNGSDVKVTRRWAVSGHTDHRIHFVERTIVNVPDFPRQ
jgi:hypothetical protein